MHTLSLHQFAFVFTTLLFYFHLHLHHAAFTFVKIFPIAYFLASYAFFFADNDTAILSLS